MKKKAVITFDELKEKSSIEFRRKKWKALDSGDKDMVIFTWRSFALQISRYNSKDEPFELELFLDWKNGVKKQTVIDVFGQTINGVLRELEGKLAQIVSLVYG